MEHNRKSYVEATDRLVSFLDEVTSALQSTSHTAHRRLLESTRYAVNLKKYNLYLLYCICTFCTHIWSIWHKHLLQ